MHPKVKAISKATLGLLLVGYVLRSRMVDLHSLKSVLLSPWLLPVSLGLVLLSTILCAERWKQLARAQGFDFSFRTLFSMAMIGSFFNTFLPGAVGGDLVKAWYIAGEEPQRKSRAILTVLVDRIIGLSVILLYSSVTLMAYTGWLTRHRELPWIAAALWIFTGAFAIAGALFFWPSFWRQPILKRLFSFLSPRIKIEPLFQSLRLFSQSPARFFNAIALSVLSMLSAILLFVLLGYALHIRLSLAEYLFIVPLGITFSAIPLLPGGIGTGQVAFYTLFLWMKIPHPEQGGSLCTLYQIYTILFSCFGGFYYLSYKSAAKDSQVVVSTLSTSLPQESESTNRRAVP